MKVLPPDSSQPPRKLQQTWLKPQGPADCVELGTTSAPPSRLGQVVGNQPICQELKQLVDTSVAQGKPFPYQSYLMNGAPGNAMAAISSALRQDLSAWGIKTFNVSGDKLVLESGAKGLKKVFEEAHRAAAASPNHTAAIFIDDVEKAFPIRSHGVNSSRNRLLGAFLDESGSLQGDNGTRLLLVGTSSDYNAIDSSAFKKFERGLEVKAPADATERLQILKQMVVDKGYELALKADLKELAEGMRGSNEDGLQSVLKTANRLAGGEPITTATLREARLQEKYGAPLPVTNPDWMFRLTACHEMGHAVIRDFFDQIARPDDRPEGIDLISLVPREGTEAAVQLKYNGNPAKTLAYYVAEISSNYGGRVAESVFGDGHLSAGPGSDIRSATQSAKDAVLTMGMGKTLGAIQPSEAGLQSAYESKAKADQENLLAVGHKLAADIIDYYKPFIDSFADQALANKNSPEKLMVSGREFHEQLVQWQQDDSRRLSDFEALRKQALQAVADLKPPA